ncbi:MAG: hypothetical protein IH947_05300 [Bacteroidetes bacterium]|nr:hypothetical protein [Bacteroidota bacterium]
MIKQGLIYCIILINSAPVLAQWELPPGALVRKQIHQLRDTDTDEWEDFGVTTKAYDARGREVYEESRIKSDNGSWYINQKGFYAYNNFGNLTRYHFKSYQANPHKLGYESLKEYEYLNDTLLTRIYKLNKDLINNEQWESWDFFIYDHKNRNIRPKLSDSRLQCSFYFKLPKIWFVFSKKVTVLVSFTPRQKLHDCKTVIFPLFFNE